MRVFERDPDMEAFYTYGPAIAAGVKLQHGLEHEHDVSACRRLITHFTRQGGDRGAGMKYIRMGCGLKVTPPAQAAVKEGEVEDTKEEVLAETLGIAAEPSSQDDPREEDDPFWSVSLFLARDMLTRGMQHLSHERCRQVNMQSCVAWARCGGEQDQSLRAYGRLPILARCRNNYEVEVQPDADHSLQEPSCLRLCPPLSAAQPQSTNTSTDRRTRMPPSFKRSTTWGH